MAEFTSKELRRQVMYQIFVRNFSPEGTFSAVIPELDRIQALGVDIVWFAPIHPIGKKQRKGSLGSPYAISDYRAVNPEYGTVDDLRAVVEQIHARGMKCIIDVVYNHTSPDSVLAAEHPEWFYHRPDGSFGNRVGDWSDIIDLDYSNKELWDYQIETLKMWAQIVDGFRCDVAPLVPIVFWQKARKEVEEVRPGCLWLSESVDPGFLLEMRERGWTAHSDAEIYQAFDMSYEYDVYGGLIDYLLGKAPLSAYADAISRQEYIYPDNYVKLRFLENHDQPRAAHLFPDAKALRSATAFLYFQKGMTLIYAGQEQGIVHRPTLFDKDTVPFGSGCTQDLSGLMARLSAIRKDPLFADSTYHVTAPKENVLVAEHRRGGRRILGVFPLDGKPCVVPVSFPEGTYTNRIDGRPVDIFHGFVATDGEPVIL